MWWIVGVVIVALFFLVKHNNNNAAREKLKRENQFDAGIGDSVGFEGSPIETQFFQLCELLGCRENVITSVMGIPDDTYINDYGTKFLYYDCCRSNVTIPSDVNVAKYVNAHRKNAKGDRPDASDDFWEIGRIKLGDTRSAVQEAWGPPSAHQGGSQLVYYTKKSWKTKNKAPYVVGLRFDKDVLCDFDARLEEDIL